HVWQFRGGSLDGTLDFGPLLYSVGVTAEAAPSALGFRQLTIQENYAEEDIITAAFNARHNFDLGDNSYIQFGIRIRDAEKMQDNANARYDRGTAPNRFTLADFGLLGDPTTTYLDGASYYNYPT